LQKNKNAKHCIRCKIELVKITVMIFIPIILMPAPYYLKDNIGHAKRLKKRVKNKELKSLSLN
jgi:hypothetical protein